MAYDMGAKRMREAGEYGMGRLGKPTGVSEVMEVHHAVCVCLSGVLDSRGGNGYGGGRWDILMPIKN